MLHQLLNIKRPLFILDTETTGLTQEDRIIELGFQRWESEGLTKEWRSLINPEMHIANSVTGKHGITDEHIALCQACGNTPSTVLVPGFCKCEQPKIAPTFKQLARYLVKGFHDCDYGGQNVRFDLRMLDAEMRRANVSWSYAGARIIDSNRLEAIADPRDLGSMHEKATGKKHDGAHGALSDVRASTTVLAWQFTRDDKLPRDLDQLHELSWPGWLCSDGSIRMVNGVPTVMFGKHRDVPMEKVPVSYWDWIIKEKFAEDVKQLAADAKLGKFPGVV